MHSGELTRSDRAGDDIVTQPSTLVSSCELLDSYWTLIPLDRKRQSVCAQAKISDEKEVDHRDGKRAAMLSVVSEIDTRERSATCGTIAGVVASVC